MKKDTMKNLSNYIIVFVLLSLGYSVSFSQTDQDSIAENVIIGSVKWSNNSERIYFAIESYRNWKEYDLDTTTINNFNKFPFSIELTDEQMLRFNPILNNQGNVDFAFISPNESYVAYIFNQRQQGRWQHPLAIANLDTNNIIVTDIYVSPAALQFNVFWSEDSTSLIVKNNTGFSITFHYIANMFDPEGYILRSSVDLLSTSSVQFVDVLDISPDGEQIILQDGYRGNFVLWKPSKIDMRADETVLVELEYRIADIAFIDKENLLIATYDGLFTININNPENIFEKSSLIERFSPYQYISPDACKIAIIDEDINNTLIYNNLC